MAIIKFIKKYYYLFLFLFIVGFVSTGSSPFFHPAPHRDSGIFLYIGDRILSGDVLYRDLWAHRGPIVFLINSLGLLVAPGSVWGVWIVETAFVYFAAILSYKFFEKLYGKLPAVLTTIFWLFYFNLIRSSNFSENYYVLIQFALLYLFLKAESAESKKMHYIGIGAVAAVGFLIRMNMVGIAIVIILIWLWQMVVKKQVKVQFQKFLFSGIGALLVLGITSIVLYSKGAFTEFIEQAFRFNFSYFGGKTVPFFSMMEHANNTVDFVMAFAVVGWLIPIIWLFGKFSENLKVNKKILAFSIMYFPLEIYFAGLSGEKYVHYLMPLFASIALLSGFIFYLIPEFLPKTDIWKSKIKLNQLVVCIVLFGFTFFPLIEHYTYSKIAAYNLLIKQQLSYRGYSESTAEILDYIEANTKEDDFVYFWGIELGYNFLSGRESLNKYWNGKIFLHDEYIENDLVSEFEAEILEKRPLIIDPSPEYKYLAPLFNRDTEQTGFGQVHQLIRENYVLVDTLESNGWLVYEFAD